MSGLYDRAAAILTAAQNALGESCPPRAFVTIGPPAWDTSVEDCVEQLTVTLRTVQMHRGGDRNPCFVALKPTYSLCLLRCVTAIDPDTTIPAAPLLNAEAVRLYDDAVLLLNGITAAWDAGTLFPGAECSTVFFGNFAPQGPDGGLAGWQWDITLDPL